MSRFPAFGRWRWLLVLFVFLSVAGNRGAQADCNPGFGMCNHHNSNPEVLTHPDLFIVYWGPEWGNGISSGFAFKTASGQIVIAPEYVNYLEGFLAAISPSGVGAASAFLDTQRQYGENDPPNFFIDHWFDGAEPPAAPSTDQMAGEAIKAYAHFANVFGSNDQVIIVVALPPGHGYSGFPNTSCAYHFFSNAIFGMNGPPWVYYIALPFEPEAGTSCVGNPNASDSFGHGVLDGVSVGLAHELAETLTDPLGGSWYGYNTCSPNQPGCNPAQQSPSFGETGDKCNTLVSNIGYSAFGQSFFWAAQYLWSNSAVETANGCVLGAAPNVTANSSLDFGSQVVHVIGANNTQTVFAGNSGTADFSGVAQPSPWQLDDSTKSFFIFPAKCPQTLHPGDQCSTSVGFIPNQIGPLQATLYFNSGSGGSVQHITSTTLTATGLSPPRIPIRVGVPFFPPIFVGPICPEPCPQVQGLAIVNQDISPHTISSVSLGGLPTTVATTSAISNGVASSADFAIVADRCSGADLGAGASCTVDIRFTPQVTGERYSTLDFLDESGTERGGVLAGVGLGPAAQLTGAGLGATGLVFPEGELSVTQVRPLKLTSVGQAPLTIKSISADGDFIATSDCPTLLGLGLSCTINVSLTPAHYNFQNGLLTVSDDASDSPQTVRLAGNADASFAAVSPGHLRFGCVRKNTTSAPQTVRLAGLEGPPFSITSIAASDDFQQSNNCSSPLLSPCTITVVFKPHRPGQRTGTLTVVSDAANGTQQVALQGVGTGSQNDENERCREDEDEGHKSED